MSSFWNKKTPKITLIAFVIADVAMFFATSPDSRWGYWPPAILLVAILYTILNNLRIDRMNDQGTDGRNAAD